MKKFAALFIVCSATLLSSCKEEPCIHCYCLGPTSPVANAPARPVTCNGDWVIGFEGLYWKALEDGLEYAVCNQVVGSDGVTANREMNNLIGSEFLSPGFGWDFGFKLNVGYNTSCDGWDIEILWTRYSNGVHGRVSAEFEDNVALLPLWSAFQSPSAGNAPILFANEIDTFWKLKLNFVDAELGREFWTSPRLSVRPHMGFRYASIDQSYAITHRGGSWENLGNANENFNGVVELDNDFKGIGLIAGLDTLWHFGCGFGLYGTLSTSIIYGRFSLDHHENLRLAQFPYTKTRIYEADEGFRSSRSTLDLGLGVQWAALFCNCKYAVTIGLGYESHLLFHQNQMRRVIRLGGENSAAILNPSGENVYNQTRGTLTTSGWTIHAHLAF